MTRRAPALLVLAVLAAVGATVGCDTKSGDADKPAASDSKDPPGAAAQAPAEAPSPTAEPAPASAPAPAPAPTGRQLDPVDISSAKAPADTWMELAAADHKFKARFPVAPKKEDMSVPTPAGTVPGAMWLAERGEEAVGVTVMTVPEAMLGGFNVEGALDGGRDGMINNVGGTIVSEKQTDFAGHKARALVASVPNPNGGEFELEARLFWVSPRMYQLISLVPKGSGSPTANKYFDSFELTRE